MRPYILKTRHLLERSTKSSDRSIRCISRSNPRKAYRRHRSSLATSSISVAINYFLWRSSYPNHKVHPVRQSPNEPVEQVEAAHEAVAEAVDPLAADAVRREEEEEVSAVEEVVVAEEVDSVEAAQVASLEGDLAVSLEEVEEVDEGLVVVVGVSQPVTDNVTFERLDTCNDDTLGVNGTSILDGNSTNTRNHLRRLGAKAFLHHFGFPFCTRFAMYLL